MAYVSRDPFARTELHRARVYAADDSVVLLGCAWCNHIASTRSGRKYLYCYRTEHDAGRQSPMSGLFCSVSCMRSFHG